VITALEATAEALVRLSLFERAAVAHSYAARLRVRYGFFTAYTWDNDARDRLLRERARAAERLGPILNDTAPIEWPEALAAATLLDGLVDTTSY
jgi:hypothetical protein